MQKKSPDVLVLGVIRNTFSIVEAYRGDKNKFGDHGQSEVNRSRVRRATYSRPSPFELPMVFHWSSKQAVYVFRFWHSANKKIFK